MPEGHTIHRLAREQRKHFAGQIVRASSPQGRFADGAAQIDGLVLRRTEAWGKHLLHHYAGGPLLHVHLGLYGKFTGGTGEPPVPRGALRLRLSTDERWTDLRGPIACELLLPGERQDLLARLGPDPLRPHADPGRAFARLAKSKISIAALLMDQKVIAGIGNVYRAELLFRHRIDPFRPGRSIDEHTWSEVWTDLVTLMGAGVRSGRIVTVRPEDRPRARGRLTREEAVYVYRRTGLPCRVCGTEVRTQELVGRNLFWCPNCQRS
ncbi:MAG TPA: DNA-formamidopyrimidine glycosylase family protein [Jatrophihabitans sp.]|jgi:formamidopyrimidine-DNA glycosylase